MTMRWVKSRDKNQKSFCSFSNKINHSLLINEKFVVELEITEYWTPPEVRSDYNANLFPKVFSFYVEMIKENERKDSRFNAFTSIGNSYFEGIQYSMLGFCS